MLKNYLTIALRTIRRHPGHTLLNVAGLAVGLACALLVLSYVRLEGSFDRFHENADRMYRVVQHQQGNVFLGSDRFAVMPAGLGKALREETPGVAEATTFTDQNMLVEHGDHSFMESGLGSDAHFFRVFSFPLERGDPATVLTEPNTIVLTASLAQKLFAGQDPIGQTLRLHNRQGPIDYEVTGLVADPPTASHIQFTFVRSILSDPDFQRNIDNWGNSSWYTYLTLNPGQTIAALEARMADLIRKYRPEEDDPARFYVEALTDIHLHSHINFDLAENNDIRLLYLFSAIALVILLLACVNYTNLAVARSVSRAREIGMRKVVGASQWQIAAQHLGESVLTALLALVLGLGLAQLAMPVFSSWLERDLVLGATGAWGFYLGALALALLVGLVAGAYPAFVMTRLRPASILKGAQTRMLGRFRLRALLVVGQYAAAIMLVIGSLVIYQQMQFIQSRPLGFDREHVISLYLRGIDVEQELPGFKEALQQVSGVEGVTASTHLPTNISSSTSLSAWEGHPEVEDEEVEIYQAYVDYDFFDVYAIPLVVGRAFSPAHPSDSVGAIVLNETAVNQLGWTVDTAVGKTIQRGDGDIPVIGVVKDFHMHAMHLPVAPLMMQLASTWINRVSIRVRPDDLPTTLAGIEAAWMQRSPYPFEYQFVDENFDQMYRAEQKLGQGVSYFTLIALFIAGLGLFGLAAHAARQRTKEIGIRKVLGASVVGLVGLLSKDFLKLVAVAFVIAAPIAYFAMAKWLEAFAYRIALGPGVFVLAGLAAVAIAFLTVSYQAIKASLADPVESLRYE
ncbi:MAG TPA: ABC transporter permease [Rhodothermales bacterium]|nr:ABC transporter permease [Rhodothermales bacterium]